MRAAASLIVYFCLVLTPLFGLSVLAAAFNARARPGEVLWIVD